MGAEARLTELLTQRGIEMPPVPQAKGLYKTLLIEGNLAYTSGHLPATAEGTILRGKVGRDLDVQTAQKAAELTGLGMLATLKAQLGSLDRVRRVVKLFGMVNCTPEFDQQPAVIDGCSQLLADVFGPDAGVGTRSAMGAGSLPLGVPVEIEAVFEIQAP